MNKVILIGRLTRDPDIRYSQGTEPMAIARYSLAVDRRSRDRDNNADFPNCIAFGKNAEFAEKYLQKGLKIAVVGHIQTGSYTDRDGRKVYTTDVVIESQEFVESKAAAQDTGAAQAPAAPPGIAGQPAPGIMPQPAGQPYFQQGYTAQNAVQQPQAVPQQQFAPNIASPMYTASSIQPQQHNAQQVQGLASQAANNLAEGFMPVSPDDEGLPWN